MFGGHSDLIGMTGLIYVVRSCDQSMGIFGGSIDSTLSNNGGVCDTSQNLHPKGRWENRLTWLMTVTISGFSADNELWIH
jgi:hypothetical protein